MIHHSGDQVGDWVRFGLHYYHMHTSQFAPVKTFDIAGKKFGHSEYVYCVTCMERMPENIINYFRMVEEK